MLDLANAAPPGSEPSRADLAAVLARHGERAEDLSADTFSDADAAELRAAIRELRDVLTASDTDRAAERLNALLAHSGARPRLSRHDGHPWHLHVDRADDAGWGDWLRASSALALARLLSERGALAWGECAADTCSRLYLADNPGTPRRFCSPTCATRTRVATYRRTHRP
ncbi:CGNR zinc finger domain-containing protein [Streptomyces sp. OF8]|uniref:CGNR zinc finger domain-containing protein n=2 Tax=Streptomyces alkaliterrae TaxID=2213162 RepID=A0A7W3ZVG3_9ACTN|nr:CGNR zinc finger domain-containing protein [Streptomyces alkaliterrae]